MDPTITATIIGVLLTAAFGAFATAFAWLRSDTNVRLDKVDARFDKMDEKVDARFDKMDEKVDARFDRMDEKVDARFDKMDARFRAAGDNRSGPDCGARPQRVFGGPGRLGRGRLKWTRRSPPPSSACC